MKKTESTSSNENINWEKNFVEGRKAMAKNRYLAAIEYFIDTYKILQQKWWEEGTSDQEIMTLIDCSYLIGLCYYELGDYFRAYKYLEFSASFDLDTNIYIAKYIDCLIDFRDVRACKEIDRYLDFLENKKEEKRTKDDFEFYMFLLNRRAYCMIELKIYDQAEVTLNRILELDPENQYAKEWIDPVKQMREEQEVLINKQEVINNKNLNNNPYTTPSPIVEKELITDEDEPENTIENMSKTNDTALTTGIGIVLIIILVAIFRYILK